MKTKYDTRINIPHFRWSVAAVITEAIYHFARDAWPKCIVQKAIRWSYFAIYLRPVNVQRIHILPQFIQNINTWVPAHSNVLFIFRDCSVRCLLLLSLYLESFILIFFLFAVRFALIWCLEQRTGGVAEPTAQSFGDVYMRRDFVVCGDAKWQYQTLAQNKSETIMYVANSLFCIRENGATSKGAHFFLCHCPFAIENEQRIVLWANRLGEYATARRTMTQRVKDRIVSMSLAVNCVCIAVCWVFCHGRSQTEAKLNTPHKNVIRHFSTFVWSARIFIDCAINFVLNFIRVAHRLNDSFGVPYVLLQYSLRTQHPQDVRVQ